ncbi:DUF4839 domain-containing protein [Planococcus sp. PAMC 21323]|uniref:DUF4839 domain-containing protein n=1 Tax=Planococcus sp. PAMC 21323 TaxID=1526927 RepID=UPI0018CE83F3|nr:DUF4839 domain-containing protein [Planococcus sp. PAMC 21323]
MKKLMFILSLTIVAVLSVACADEADPNILKVSKSSDEIIGENYETVITELKAVGFTDIETKVLDDLITEWLTKDGEIEQVEIDGKAEFNAKDSFQKDSKVIITYHIFPEEEKADEKAVDEKSSDKDEELNKEDKVEETANEELGDDETDKQANNEVAGEEVTEKTKAESSPQVLTIKNNEELAALLAVKDEYDPIISEFTKKYAGRTIEFDANIVNMMNHGSYDTRYDILMFSGDFSETTFSGPNFKFEDVNMNNLNLTGSNIPDYLRMGQNLRITAIVEEFDEDMGIVFLDPVITEIR